MLNKDYKSLFLDANKRIFRLSDINARLTDTVNAYKIQIELLKRENTSLRNGDPLKCSLLKDDKVDAFTPGAFTLLAITKVSRIPYDYALIVFDLDNFKGVNDTYGHYAGDIALRTFCDILNGNTREAIDIVGRFGGDEFIVLLEKISKEDALNKAEKILMELESTPVRVNIDGKDVTFNVSASAGVTMYEKDLDASGVQTYTLNYSSEEERELNKIYLANFMKADKCLYEAKQDGKNKAHLSEDDMKLSLE